MAAPRIRVIPFAEQPVMPWANGGGSTRQVAIDPPDGSLQRGFRWRVSCAQVASDGPFSRLPGVDRSLWLVRGGGMRLRFADREVVLAEPMQRVDFSGEDEVAAQLLGGPSEDCNVMVTRGVVRAEARIERIVANEAFVLDSAQACMALVLEGGIATCDGRHVADAGDALRVDGPGRVDARAGKGSVVLVARFAEFR